MLFNLGYQPELEPEITVTNPPISSIHVYLCYDSLEEPESDHGFTYRRFDTRTGEGDIYSWWTVVAIGRLRRAVKGG